MKRTTVRAPAVGLAATVLLLGLGACSAANESATDNANSSLSGTLNGGGASSQESAVTAWRQGFQTAHPDVTVNYDTVGSGGGREQFLAGGLSFAGSDAYLSDAETEEAEKRCASEVLSVPVYVSPIAVIHRVDGVSDLQLDPETLGAIFEGTITSWDDPAITATNPGADLPSSTITPVHRADDSGTTENFTDYLAATSGGSWTGGSVESWPITRGEAADGTSGVVSAVKAGSGTIGYADASQAGDLGTVAVKVGDDFVQPEPEAAARVLDTATAIDGRATTNMALGIDRTTTAEGVYPIVMVSYQFACEQYEDAAEQELVKSWLTWVASSEGQQKSAKSAGSAPLTSDFADKVQSVIDTIN